MPTRPPSPDPTGASSTDSGSNPFATLGAGLGAGLGFFQDWMKAAGSALPNLQGATGGGTPGMSAWTMPTLDPAELEKRIQDLKTVQFWLEQNARMVGMTIQGLEVQRMTLSTLKGMNVSMDALRDSLKARPAPPPPAPASPAPHTYASPSHRQAEADETSGSDDAPAEAPSSPSSAGAAAEGAELINPMRWWDTLTQQFTHLASQAAQTVGDSVGESMDIINKQAQAAGFTAQAAPKPAARKASTNKTTASSGNERKAGTSAAGKPSPTKAPRSSKPAKT